LSEDDSWKCGNCGRQVAAIKQMELYKSPNILVMSLNRFKAAQLAGGNQKITDLISFPV